MSKEQLHDITYSVYRAIDKAIDDGEFTVEGDIEDLTEPAIDNGYVMTLTVDGQRFDIRVG